MRDIHFQRRIESYAFHFVSLSSLALGLHAFANGDILSGSIGVSMSITSEGYNYYLAHHHRKTNRHQFMPHEGVTEDYMSAYDRYL